MCTVFKMKNTKQGGGLHLGGMLGGGGGDGGGGWGGVHILNM